MIINKIINKAFSIVNNHIVLPSEYYKTTWGGANKFWHIRNFNLDVVNLGSNSGVHAFDYSGMKLLGMNWALGPQSLVHDFSILKNYFSYLKENATVIITLCPFSCLVSSYNKQQNLKYYTFLHPATIQEFDESEHIRALTLKKQNVLRVAPLHTLKGMLRSYKRCVSSKIHSCDYENNASNFIESWKKQFGISDLDACLSRKHLQEQELRASNLSEMIDFCLERKLRPVLIIPPIHPELRKYFTDSFVEHYINDFLKKGNIQSAFFRNYMFDQRFDSNNYFLNSLFLNKKGAQIFTEIVLHDIGLMQ